MRQYGNNFIPIIPVDEKLHTDEKPFCNATLHPDCPCREDETVIQQVERYVSEGLLTPQEATRTVEGKML